MEKEKEVLFKVEKVSKIYGNRYILNNINFEVYGGEILGIIGTSGSGKTTLLNMLSGFIKPDKGNIYYRDSHLISANKTEDFRNVSKHQNQLKRGYGFAAQVPSFYPNLTVKENLHYFGSLYNLTKQAIKINTENLLQLVGLTQSQHVLAQDLSGGMQRRLDIACSLIHNPHILMLDEPTADLDPILGHKIWSLLHIINQKGTTIILASHHLSELEEVCNRIVILQEGRIAAIGKPEEIKAKSQLQESIILQSYPGNYNKIIENLKKLNLNDIQNYTIKENKLFIQTLKPREIIHKVLNATTEAEEKVIDVEIIKPTLDKVFVKMNTPKEDTTIKSGPKKNKKRYKKKRRKKYFNKE